MTFSIHVLPRDVTRARRVRAEIVLGEHIETFPLITTLWREEDYQKQWRVALRAIAKGEVSACMLITDIQPTQISSGITYWAIFIDGQQIVAQERLMRFSPEPKLLFRPTEVERLIPPRIQGSEEDHDGVSEWILPLGDIVSFVNNQQN